MLFALGLALSAQTASDESPKPAPNAWMLAPTPYLEWNKDISSSVRKERDRYLDRGAIGQRYPLTSPRADPLGPGIGCGMPKTEIPPAINRVILTGTFTKHRSVLSASEFSLYSEITVHVDEVFEDQNGSGAAPGEDITILVSGGTVMLASGRILSYGTQPIRFSLQPDHRYLLILSHYGVGSFYLVEDDWDIVDGVLRFNTRSDEYRAQHGLSSLSGLKVEQLGPALATLLKEQK
jgi:hypothetical protein